MKLSEAALAALLLTIVAEAPAAAQQVALTHHQAVSEFCSGCFAYLEFPPPPQEASRSSLASTHQETAATTIAAQERPMVALMPDLVAPVK